MADALLLFLPRDAHRRRACARRRQGGQGWRVQERDLRRSWQAVARARRPGALPAGLSRDKACGIGRHVRRRQGGDGSHGPMAARHAGAEFDQRQGSWPRRTSASSRSRSCLAARARRPTRSGGINGWLVSKSAPPEAVDFLKFFSQEKYAKEAAAKAAYIPVVKGSESRIHRSGVSSASPTISPRRPTTRTISTRTSGRQSGA